MIRKSYKCQNLIKQRSHAPTLEHGHASRKGGGGIRKWTESEELEALSFSQFSLFLGSFPSTLSVKAYQTLKGEIVVEQCGNTQPQLLIPAG